MTTQDRAPSRWAKLPISLRAVISGLLITLAAVDVWPLLLLNLGVPLAAFAEAIFLGLFLWWTGGGGPPRTTGAARATAFRRGRLSPTQWFWGVIAALFFAATIHASIVLLFRLVSFPMAAFRHGYDVSFIPSQSLRWLAVVVSATSAGICEETGFRGYMQRPIEQRHGAPVAILISSFSFMALHLTKAWATPLLNDRNKALRTVRLDQEAKRNEGADTKRCIEAGDSLGRDSDRLALQRTFVAATGRPSHLDVLCHS
jgi:membrane protease YdiL (CAAX protease family)